MKKIAIQGEAGSFHDIAAHMFYGDNIEIVNCETFKDAFEAVAQGRAESAVCAIENSLYGSINQTYDLLLQNHFLIQGEVHLRVEQCLIGLEGSSIQKVEKVYSHPVALAQCEDFLETEMPLTQKVEYYDTAASVAKVKALKDQRVAAIGSRAAADLYGMTILAPSIETNKQNYTRFIVLSPSKAVNHSSNKTSLIIKTTHKPGALHSALGAFAKRSINLSKLQSRPIIGKAWRYMFYIDVDCGLGDSSLLEALEELVAQKCSVEVLGSYKSSR